MSKTIEFVSFKEDSKKTEPSKLDIFDRVINLRLTTSDENGIAQDTYTIRSDFELYYPKLMDTITANDIQSFQKLNKCYVRKCQYKPAIKVQYKRVSLNASVEVDIFISNFYMLDKNGQMISGFNNSDYKLSKVEFSMGYFGQYYEAFSKQVPQSIEAFMKVGFNENATEFGIPVMTMSNVEYCQMDKLPPDMTLHIHGYVGNTLAPKFDLNTKDFPKEYDKLMNSNAVIQSSKIASKSGTFLEDVYYETMTKNWLKQGTLTKAESAKINSGKEYTTDTMSDSDAEKYGIKVYLSVGAKAYSDAKKSEWTLKDKNGNIVYSVTTIPKASTAEAKMNNIEGHFKLLDFAHIMIPTTGDYVVCLQTELDDIKSLIGQNTTLAKLYEKTAVSQYFDNQIPAVYNITTDALCTIVCPFFCFINPFEVLHFKTRYALGGLVSYYANFNATEDTFYALWQNVSFATVEDINECSIVCTGSKSKSSS